MEDRDKTKDELIQELVLLRQKLTKMETDQDPLSVSDDVVRQEDEIYRSFYENLPLGYQSLDEHGCFLEVNQAWLNTMGYSREDVIGKWFGDFITLGYQETFRANFLKFKAAGEIRRAELEILKKDQSTIFAVFEGKISRHLDGRFKQTHCVLLDITQAKRVEDALRYSEALKQAILDGITTNIAFVNEDLEILWANKTAAGSVGKSLSEMLGHTCHSLWADNAKPCPDCPTVEAFKTKKSYHTTIATPDGRIWDEKGEPVFDAQGNLLGVVEIAHDITERKRAEEALRESEAKFRLITEAMVDIVWTMDLNLQTTYVSPSIERLLGFTQEERLRQSIEEQVTPESLLKIRDTLTEELAKEQHGTTDPDRYITIVVEQYKKDGSTVWLENMVRAIRDPQGMIIGLHGLSRDVTERKRAEEALRQSYRRLEESQRIGKIGTFEWNAVTGETCWSDEVYRIFGLEPGSVVPSYELAKEHTFPADTDLWQQTVSESLASKKKFQLQCRFLRKDGTIIWIDNQGDIIWDADGTATGIFGTIQDITQRKNLEVELLQSQKMQAIGTLAAGIAHDFNNMLQVILGYTDLLLLGKKEGQPGYKELKKIIKTSRDARNLVQKIRIFSRKADIQPVPLDLNHEVEGVAKILSHTLPKTIDLDIHLAQDLAMINADPGLMNQMVMNLGINAGEAMPDGGTLTIESKNILLDDDSCQLLLGVKPGPHVLLTVSDTGIGIRKELQDRIFDPFFSTKARDHNKGTGLGLPVVQGIVEQHRGYLRVDSEAGKGTTFRIYLPALETGKAAETVDEISRLTGGNETILLVEDDEVVRDLGRDILEQFGYKVLAVCDGQEAVEVYERDKNSISIVILDIIMPRMDGKKCLQELLKMNPAVKVLISSGVAEDDLIQAVVGLGAKGSLMKPFDVSGLMNTVREVLDRE